MGKKLFYSLLLFAVSLVQINAREIKRDSLFDSDWKFIRGKVNGAEKPDFEDKTWRNLTLPHDWSIEDLVVSDLSPSINEKERIISGPFDSEAVSGNATGYTVGGIGWYRKHFRLPKEYADKVVTILFDGVYMNSDVWINGHHLGNHPYGYTAFEYDLSNYLKYGDAENVIAVEVKNEGRNSRWYSGSGIYRHVYLQTTEKLHIATWGTFVTTTNADSLHARIEVKASVNNYTLQNADITFVCKILNPASEIISEKKLFTQIHNKVPSILSIPFDVLRPELWTLESPAIYTTVCEIVQNGNVIDRTETKFGIRTLRFDSEKGFFLNGKHLKLKGGAMHADNGPLGAVANDRAEERKVELMKAAGFNAIRCAHNPPSSVFLDACDRLGMLVLLECFDVWTKGWNDDDYQLFFNDWWKKDVTNILMRDRNHPSIFAWGIGNQIRENRDSIGVAIAYQIAGLVRSLDPSRAVAADVALTGKDWRNGSPDEWRTCDPLFSSLDICGYSYQSSQYENDHQRLPNRIMFSIEIDPRNSFDNWMKALDYEYVLGNFEWTAMDYLGESASGWFSFAERPKSLFPWSSSYTGDIDVCGFKKPRSYYRDILFNNENKLSVFVKNPVSSFEGNGSSLWGWEDVKASWTWPGYNGKSLSVVAYSGCDSVQLILNGKIIGTKQTSRETEFKAVWQVPYERGTLKAVGYTKGIKTAEWSLTTANKPTKIRLTPDRTILKADGQDLCFVTVEVTDKNGILNPQFNGRINFSIEGEGKIVAVGNSNPTSLESFQQPYRKAYEGKCLIIIQSNNKAGQFILRATCKGLSESRIVINAKNNR